MIKFSRKWAMPNGETFSIKPIAGFIQRHLKRGMVSIDPFARDCDLADYTNDLNPKTKADQHDDALDWLSWLVQDNIKTDLVLFDPPYSLRQTKELYQSIGIEKLAMDDTQRLGRWTKEKDVMAELVAEGGVVLSFGWNTIGMGKKRGFEIIEIMLVSHGGAHNDTICMAERKVKGLF